MDFNLAEVLKGLESLHVLVIGDVMLDHYRWGDVERISPEAPVPIVQVRRIEDRLGGAANVALNCRALGAKVTVASIVGNDANGRTLQGLLDKDGIDTSLIEHSDERITTTKTRIISKNQQMLRFDMESTQELSIAEEHAFIDRTLRFLQIHKPQVVIFEDYNKGLLKENVVQRIIAHCKALGILMAVDPKKDNFFVYKGVDIFKPNLKEVREGLGIALTEINADALDRAHMSLREKLGHQVSFITLSEHGVYYNDGQSGDVLPSHLRNVADVSGAGDTVIAVAAMVYALTRDARLMASWSNIAGGLVCEEVGVVPIRKERWAQEIEKIHSF